MGGTCSLNGDSEVGGAFVDADTPLKCALPSSENDKAPERPLSVIRVRMHVPILLRKLILRLPRNYNKNTILRENNFSIENSLFSSIEIHVVSEILWIWPPTCWLLICISLIEGCIWSY